MEPSTIANLAPWAANDKLLADQTDRAKVSVKFTACANKYFFETGKV